MQLRSRILALLFVLVGIAALAPALSAAVNNRSAMMGDIQLLVDGNVLPEARGWAGGEHVATILAEGQPVAGVQKKRVTSVALQPLRVTVAASDDPALRALMHEALTGAGTPHTVVLNQLDGTGRLAATTTYPNARVVGVELPAYDGAVRDTSEVVLTFSAATVSRTAGTGATLPRPAARGRVGQTANFRFTLDGLPTTRVARVSAFTALGATGSALGSVRDPGTPPTPLGLANLVLEISAADLPAWQAWADSFLVQGNNADATEKTGTLAQLSADLSTALFTVQFSHVGLVRLSPVAPTADTLARFAVELYVEGASLVNAPAAPAANPAPAPAPTPETPAPAPAPTDATPPAPTVTQTPAGPKATDRLAGSAATPPVGSVAALNDPADQGVRDPRDFVRVAGLVRQTYESSHYEAMSSEVATYTAKAAPADVVAAFETALANAGWELARKGDGAAVDFNRPYGLRWTKRTQSADCWFTVTKTGGTKVSVTVETRRQGVLAALAAASAEAAAPAVAKGGSPNDLGDRDPADFPRPDRALRKSYNVYGKPPTQSEDVVYRAKLPIAAVEAFYVRELGGADWERTLRSEFGDPLGGSHVVSTEWKRGKRAVKILLREIDAGVTDISLSLAAYN